jgi:putative endonuclease
MPKHKEIGFKGEQTAVNFMKNKGFDILATNWRYGKKEIDIVAAYCDTLVFVEVKTRGSKFLSFPEESVSAAQRSHLLAAGAAYFEANSASYKGYRFDIISIIQASGTVSEIVHFVNAF